MTPSSTREPAEPTSQNKPEHSIRVVKHSSVSTGWLSALLHVHVRPINLVVFQGTFGLNPTKPHLGAGFTLICFQRLSVPFIAIQPCR